MSLGVLGRGRRLSPLLRLSVKTERMPLIPSSSESLEWEGEQVTLQDTPGVLKPRSYEQFDEAGGAVTELSQKGRERCGRVLLGAACPPACIQQQRPCIAGQWSIRMWWCWWWTPKP